MAGYQVIADVSRHLLGQVREAVCPVVLPHPEQVGLYPPGKKDGDTLLNLYLYSIRDFSSYQPGRQVSLHQEVRSPPKAISLHYLLFFSFHAQTPLDPLAEHQAFGRLIQWFYAHPTIDLAQVHPAADSADEPASVAFSRLDSRQKQELWSGFSEPLRPAVYLDVGPLLLGGAWETVPDVKSVEWEVLPR